MSAGADWRAIMRRLAALCAVLVTANSMEAAELFAFAFRKD